MSSYWLQKSRLQTAQYYGAITVEWYYHISRSIRLRNLYTFDISVATHIFYNIITCLIGKHGKSSSVWAVKARNKAIISTWMLCGPAPSTSSPTLLLSAIFNMSSSAPSREENCASRQQIDEVVQLFVSKTRNLFFIYQERYLSVYHCLTSFHTLTFNYTSLKLPPSVAIHNTSSISYLSL